MNEWKKNDSKVRLNFMKRKRGFYYEMELITIKREEK